MGLADTILGEERAEPKRQPPTGGRTPFQAVNDLDPKTVGDALGIERDNNKVKRCPGCGASTGCDYLDHGIHCQHDTCKPKTHKRNGFYTNIDLIKLVRRCSAIEAVNWAATQFGTPRIEPKQNTRKAANDAGAANDTEGEPCPADTDSQFVFRRGDHAELADNLALRLSPDRAHLVYDSGSQYVYQPNAGYWETVEPSELRSIVKGFAGARIPAGRDKQGNEKSVPLRISHGSSDGAVRFLADDTGDPGFFDAAPIGCAFRDCFITVEAGKVVRLPHSPENRARYAFDFEYDPAAQHAELDRFFGEVFADTSEADRDDRVACLQEITGAALLGMATSFQQAVVCYGPGGTGKSQYAEILLALFPPRAVVSLPPHRWFERFDLSHLAGAALNVVAELPAAELVSTEAFKSVIVGDQLTAERKFQPAFDFKPKCAHVFMANHLPPTSDLSDAFFRRFQIIPFTRNMISAPCHRKDVGKEIALRERPGLAVWAVEGARRLQEQGRYTESSGGMDLLRGWQRDSDSVASFVEDQCQRLQPGQSARLGTPAARLYEKYKTWSDDNGLRHVSSKRFAKRMEALKLAGVKLADGNWYPVRHGQGAEP